LIVSAMDGDRFRSVVPVLNQRANSSTSVSLLVRSTERWAGQRVCQA
jgi:hypothetical protein